MPSQPQIFADINLLVSHVKGLGKKNVIIYAYNGVGKTRLSMAFKDLGRDAGDRDTLYFNAFTEDLFSWDNDLDNDTNRLLLINKDSNFFTGIQEQDMENKIRPLLRLYADFNFLIDYEYKDKNGREFWAVTFIREIRVSGQPQNIDGIKISRGEENMFIWCFFLAIAQLAIDRQAGYNWVRYLYIDDPISSLDDNNAIAVAHHLARILKTNNEHVKAIISTHHSLFFNVLCNEFNNNAPKLFLDKNEQGYSLKDTTDSPFIYHVSMIQELDKAIKSDQLYTYHFNILRIILEKAANFHGFNGFAECLIVNDDDENKTLHTRMVSVFNHGGYSLFEPREMGDDNKKHFKDIFKNFIDNYKFNEDLFTGPQAVAEA